MINMLNKYKKFYQKILTVILANLFMTFAYASDFSSPKLAPEITFSKKGVDNAEAMFECASYYSYLAMQASVSKLFSTPKEYAKTGEKLTQNLEKLSDTRLEQQYNILSSQYSNEGIQLKLQALNNNPKFFNFLVQKYALQNYDKVFQQGYMIGRAQHRKDQVIFEGMDLLVAKKISEQAFDDKYLNPTKQCTKFKNQIN